MADGYLNFDTKINTSGFNKGISTIGKMIENAGASLTKSLTKPSVTAASALGGLTLAKGWMRMTALDNAKVKLQAIGNRAEDVSKIMDNALASVKGTAYGMDEAATTAASAVAAGIKPGKKLEGYLTAVADAAAVAGTDMSSMGAIFNKVATQGKANNEVLQQMAEAGIPIYQYLADEIGCTAGEVFDMASEGEIDLATFQKAVETHIGGAAKTIGSSTISGAISNLMASISRIGSNFLGSADDADSFAGRVLPLLNSITDVLEIVEGKAAALGGKFADSFSPIADTILNACDSFIQLDEASQNSVLKSAASGAALVAGFGPALQMFGKIVQGSESVSKGISGISKSFLSTGKSTKKNISGLLSSVGNLKDAILLPLDGINLGIRSNLKEVITNVDTPMGVITNSLSDFTKKVSGKLGELGAAAGKKLSFITKPLSQFTSYVASWGGLVGESFGGVIKSIASFAPGFIKMLKFGAIIGAVVAGLGLLQGQFGDQIQSILTVVQEKGPEIITNLCNGITSRLPELIAQGALLIQNLLMAITANIPAIVTGGVQIIAGLVMGIAQQLPSLIPAALQMILTLAQSLLSNIPQLINAGLQLITGLVQGLLNALPMLLSAAPQLIQTLVTGIAQSLPNIIQTGIQLIVSLIIGIIQAIPQLLSMIPQIFSAFVEGITSVNWIEVGKTILSMIVDGIKSMGSTLWEAVKGIFSDGEEAAEESGTATGEKYASGMSNSLSSVQASTETLAQSAVDSFTYTLDANGSLVNASTMNFANNAGLGFSSADLPGQMSSNAQVAASGVSALFNAAAPVVGLSTSELGLAANDGLYSADMSSAFAMEGVTAGDSLSSSLSGTAGAVSSAASVVAGSAQNTLALTNLRGSFTSAGQQATESFANAISSGSSLVTNAANTLGKAALQGLTTANLKGKAKTEGTNFYQSLSNAVKAGTGTVRTSITTVMNSAKAAANGLGGAGQNAGAMFSAGLARGILSGANGVAAAAAQVAQRAVTAAQANLQIHSPSRVGDWIGKMWDAGIAGGMIKNVGKVIAGVDNVSSAIEDNTITALRTLQRQAYAETTTSGAGMYRNATSRAYKTESLDMKSLLDEWERRQKKINAERDERPVLIDGRKVNRAIPKKGGVTV